MIRISLSNEDFKTLVSGGAVLQEARQKEGPPVEVSIILKDIGFVNMVDSIHEAMKQGGYTQLD